MYDVYDVRRRKRLDVIATLVVRTVDEING